MDSTVAKSSPYPSVAENPLSHNPPLAPSQELAYRNKCIQLKRRLIEIEANNDLTRKRVKNEKERIQKMRLQRAILLDRLKQILSTPGRKLSSEQLSRLGITELAELPEDVVGPKDDGMLDDSSEDSEDEDIPEPSERPTRTRRNNNNYRETIMNTTPAATMNPTPYSHSGLPSLAPANAYSPAAGREPAPSFHVASTPLAAVSPSYSQQSLHQPYHHSRYPQESSPTQQHAPLYQDSGRAASISQETNGSLVRPTRPQEPYLQFHSHMRPQLEADNYPNEQIDERIQEEWKKLSEENRGLWEQRYEEQMLEYQTDMDAYNKARRRG